ncbi:MAG: 30S ribosomal protein S27ae [Methanosaeta sp. PtaB.Bin018]|jgi:small subunit ribosomal protein S27Ae|nr:MAG: 30S ribosomal protein S27ae [Methanosaeta sp. PtaB.Bin018]OPY45405.1 MAG: 30S ribosomal protein S27ae [Methanosaeta sp. PtaU1.Bin016]
MAAAKKGEVGGVSKYYEISADSIKSKKPVCPRCGNGVFMAEHANRNSCGKCGYTEFKK